MKCLLSLSILVGATARQQSPAEIKAKYTESVKAIVDYSTRTRAGRAYEKLGEFCDTWGHRLQGSQVLEDSIYAHKETLEAEGFEVSLEPCVSCPHWERNEESIQLVHPKVAGKERDLKMLSLGRSVGTNNEPLEAKVLVVKDYDELEKQCDAAEGKIVLFNLGGWYGYGINNMYRTGGANAAAKCGAVASLVRSVTPFSMDTPHTGSMTYETGAREIPSAALTIEDTKLVQRLYDRGENITIRITMGAENFQPRLSNNIIADWKGAEKPEEFVFMSGHIDSWDIPGSDGAMDDGQGWATGWTAIENIRRMSEAGLVPAPKRTLRVTSWVAEEWGSQGAADYWTSEVGQAAEPFVSLGMGDDNGAFNPTAFAFTGSDEARAIMQAVVDMLREAGLNVTLTTGGGFEGSGIVPLIPRGTVNNDGGNTLWDEREYSETGRESFRGNYFFYHHTAADNMAMLDEVDMDLNTAMYAAISYVVADLDEMLPRSVAKIVGGASQECAGGHFPGEDAPWGVTSELCGCSTKGSPLDEHSAGLPFCQSGWPDIEYVELPPMMDK